MNKTDAFLNFMDWWYRDGLKDFARHRFRTMFYIQHKYDSHGWYNHAFVRERGW